MLEPNLFLIFVRRLHSSDQINFEELQNRIKEGALEKEWQRVQERMR